MIVKILQDVLGVIVVILDTLQNVSPLVDVPLLMLLMMELVQINVFNIQHVLAVKLIHVSGVIILIIQRLYVQNFVTLQLQNKRLYKRVLVINVLIFPHVRLVWDQLDALGVRVGGEMMDRIPGDSVPQLLTVTILQVAVCGNLVLQMFTVIYHLVQQPIFVKITPIVSPVRVKQTILKNVTGVMIMEADIVTPLAKIMERMELKFLLVLILVRQQEVSPILEQEIQTKLQLVMQELSLLDLSLLLVLLV
jgi:hypothetical protein